MLIIFAFLAGIATALSPCSLPILPILLSASSSRVRPFAILIGLVVSFTCLILFLGWLIQVLGLPQELLRYAAIVVIALFGLVLLIPRLSDWFSRSTTALVDIGERGRQSEKWGRGWVGGIVLGASLALLWTPCAGPILAAIITLAAVQTLTAKLVLVALFYSLGAALPMLVIIAGGQYVLKSSRFLAAHTESIRKFFGLLMLAMALALVMEWDLPVQTWAAQYVPSLVIEDTPMVQEELHQLQKKSGMGKLELIGISDWINSKPLSLSELHGKVVLIDFWTYSCINCIRTLPYIKEWDKKYGPLGLVIIGVHTPEFAFEKSLSNVQEAVKRFHIHYPVALDNQYQTWFAFHNSYWPADYLIDQKGMLRETHFGEGGYVETENAIRQLLGLKPIEKKEPASATALTQTAETYLGYAKAAHYAPGIAVQANTLQNFHTPIDPGADQVVLQGSWKIGQESITAESEESWIKLNFKATHVYLVLDGPPGATVEVLLDGQSLLKEYRTADMNAEGRIVIDQPRKYDLLDLKDHFGRHQLSVRVPKGAAAYAFTFGG